MIETRAGRLALEEMVTPLPYIEGAEERRGPIWPGIRICTLFFWLDENMMFGNLAIWQFGRLVRGMMTKRV